jgi:uncharacterized protein with beta-barrel porin domain
MMAFDMTAGTLYIGKNGTWLFSSNPATATNPWCTSLSGTVYPAVAMHSTSTAKLRLRSLSTQMSYAIPAGFSALAEG